MLTANLADHTLFRGHMLGYGAMIDVANSSQVTPMASYALAYGTWFMAHGS